MQFDPQDLGRFLSGQRPQSEIFKNWDFSQGLSQLGANLGKTQFGKDLPTLIQNSPVLGAFRKIAQTYFPRR